jgi:hypothetical protein
MMQLFMVYLGGDVPKANIEVHDIQFVIAETIDAAIPTLRANWFGQPKGLHMDSYVAVHHVDGYRIDISDQEPTHTHRLFFVNAGGYYPDNIAEQHECGLFVAETAQQAKKSALTQLLPKRKMRHKDDLHNIDDCLHLGQLGPYYIHLTPDQGQQQLKPDWYGYRVIDRE